MRFSLDRGKSRVTLACRLGHQFARVSQQEIAKGTDVSCWLEAGLVSHGKSTRELQATHASENKSPKSELAAHGPARNESDTEASFHGAEKAFGGVQLHEDCEIFRFEPNGGKRVLDYAS